MLTATLEALTEFYLIHHHITFAISGDIRLTFASFVPVNPITVECTQNNFATGILNQLHEVTKYHDKRLSNCVQ